MHGNIKSAFYGCVESQEGLHFLHSLGNLQCGFSFYDSGQVFGYFKAGSLCFANQHGEGRAFTHAGETVFCMYTYKSILCNG